MAVLPTKSKDENSPNVHQLMNGYTKCSLSIQWILFSCQKQKYLIGGVAEWLQPLPVIQNVLNSISSHTHSQENSELSGATTRWINLKIIKKPDHSLDGSTYMNCL